VRRPYPREFRDDVGRVARGREPGVTSEQITKEFGVHAMTSQRWLQRAAVDDRGKPGQSLTERTELRGARKQIWLLERENAVLRRAEASEATKWLSALEKPRGYCLCTPLRRAGSEGRDSPQHVLEGKLWQLPSVFTVQIMGEISPTRCEFAMYQMAIASGITAMTAEIPRRSNRIRVQGATNATAPPSCSTPSCSTPSCSTPSRSTPSCSTQSRADDGDAERGDCFRCTSTRSPRLKWPWRSSHGCPISQLQSTALSGAAAQHWEWPSPRR